VDSGKSGNAMPSVLITGANRGLGFEFARQYLADGWEIYAACRDPVAASELRQLAEDSGERLQILAMDVTDPGSVKAATAELDGQAIDLLLNNSGIIGPQGQTIGNVDYDAWAKVLDVNTMGPMRVSEAFVGHVARSDRKLICHTDERNGIDCRQYLRGLDPVSQLESRGEHGDAQPGHRSRFTRHHLRGRQSRLGAD
jgi:NAD(P)-dependent dehydrogenase (short-subunit alcohol dehydrogenase family)